MAIFKLQREEKFATWWRDYYEIEADSIEEAVEIILNGEVDPYDTEAIDYPLAEPIETIIIDSEENVVYDSRQL